MTRGMITHSGRVVTTERDIPSLNDMARALIRMPRFSGQTDVEWSVMHHTLWLHDYVLTYGDDRELLQAILLHDAHESMTGDISTHFKTDSMRELQNDLDVRIMNQWMPGGYSKYLQLKPQVRSWDRKALLAEAVVVGPPVLQAWVPWSDPASSGIPARKARELFAEHFGDQPSETAVAYLRDWRGGSPREVRAGHDPDHAVSIDRFTHLVLGNV